MQMTTGATDVNSNQTSNGTLDALLMPSLVCSLTEMIDSY